MKTRNYAKLFVAFLITLCSVSATAQPVQRIVRVILSLNHADWQYKPGEKVKFNVLVTKNDVPLKGVELRYEIAEDMMQPIKQETVTLKEGTLTIDAGTMKKAGFLRCRAYARYGNSEYEGRATAGFSPETIQPTTTLPDDFVEFWNKAKAEAAKVPMDARLTLLPERCTEKVNVYEVNIQSFRNGNRVYGILCKPKASGKYPALLRVPGAGVRGYAGDVSGAEKGFITLEIGIHGIPVTLNAAVYDNLGRAALDGYWNYNLDDKDRYYYKRVYLGCVRAVDYIFSLPEFDGKNIGVHGGSQGGALAIVTAALDSRIQGLASFYPALCDLTGYLNGRAGGWPHMFNESNRVFNNTPQKVETSKYYDVVNFARQVKVPGFYSFGFNDMVCPPTSMYSAYNVITAPKEFVLVEETAHYGYPEQWSKASEFLEKTLKNK